MDISGLSVVAKTRIVKFAEGADPKKDKPFDVVEKETVLYGQDAVRVLESQGVNVEAYMAEHNKKQLGGN